MYTWFRIGRAALLGAMAALALAVSAPQAALAQKAPTISSLSPSSAPAGGPAFTLTVDGRGFVGDCTVKWNGSSRVTTYVSSTRLTAQILAGDIAAGGTASVTVLRPPSGLSTAKTFTITAPPPPADPAIVYKDYTTNDLSVMNDDATGSNARVVLPNVGFYATPSFSADGATILFNSRRTVGASLVSGLYAIGVDGSNLRLITPFFNIDNNTYDGGGSSYSGDSAWSPGPTPEGGPWIAYVGNYYQPEGYGKLGEDIYLIRPDGTDRMRLGEQLNATGISWAPDCRRLAIGGGAVWIDGAYRKTLSLYTLRKNAASLLLEIESRQDYLASALLGEEGAEISYPSWSPTGEKIVFRGFKPSVGYSDIYAVDLSSPGAPIVWNVTNTPRTGESFPSWSPDGTKIIYVEGLGGGTFTGVTRINADGTGKTLVKSNGTASLRRRF